ncbi:hypothetical protein pqer_cds_952 [Pandoravirus quercus]|uniref:Uncharacterized protein n=1 Tax=Pandoravirus quercus TaxID=2107709 RepID=A0A2U7UAB1_9VIRU|nr:hypothetical protein pqer_cds_952 [Pandoravirus quercus]AVK75374.1 hypothetical protein pqer_cds_952 [Pandoravirus quercus]
MSHAAAHPVDLDRPARDLAVLLAARLSAPFVQNSHASVCHGDHALDVVDDVDPENHMAHRDFVVLDADTKDEKDDRQENHQDIINNGDSVNDVDNENGSNRADEPGTLNPQPGEIATDNPSRVDERISDLLSKCPEGAQRPLSTWEPMISMCLSLLPTHGPALDRPRGAPDDAPTAYSTGTVAAALARFLPALAAHGLDVYDVVLHPENMDTVTSPWDAIEPIATAYCGVGDDWLAHVECGRLWYDDVREAQELAGGTILMTHIVHRQTHTIETCCGARLGDGHDRDTEKWFAFMRSGYATFGAFADAHYGPLLRATRVLGTYFGWSLKRDDGDDDNQNDNSDVKDDDTKKDEDLDTLWGVRSNPYPHSNAFVRASDGAVVHVDWQWGSLFVGAKPEPLGLAPEAYAKPPHDRRPAKVPRPPADHVAPHRDDLRRQCKAAFKREHSDRAYLVGCGLLDPMHVAPVLGRVRSRGRHGVESFWPCTRVAFDPLVAMDAETEADWHRRLAAQMDIVADLIQVTGPALSVDNQDLYKAITTEASPQLAVLAMLALQSPARFDAETLTTWTWAMLSPMVRHEWRVASVRKRVRCGSRYIDPSRGLYVNWNMRCNFVPTSEADGLTHARFYGHLLIVDDDKDVDTGGRHTRSTGTDATADDAETGPICTPTVAAYYALSIRDPRANATYDESSFAPHRSKYFTDMDNDERTTVEAAVNAVGPTRESRFARDEPHHIIDHYRRREFAPVPVERFRGILDEGALRLDPDMPVAVAIVRAFDWLREAFDRHATIFAAEC